ncbi:MAG: 3'-5' exonuclease [Acidobacteria bacterium]|nr:3'-5' exonuclease [Acidobacteriota bacterium]
MTSMSETIYICLDVEASGPIPDPYNLVSIGAVPVEQKSETWQVRSDDLFYVELKPLYAGFDAEAMAIHGISREHLEQQGMPAAQAMEKLSDWSTSRGGRPIFVGHNAVFDWAYVNHYYVRTGVANPFGWKGLDTKALAAGVLRIPFLETHKENLAKLLPGMQPEDLSQKHRADYDALYQAEILVALLNYSG